MKLWNWLTDYFDLRRGERRGILFLSSFILILIIFNLILRNLDFSKKEDFSEIELAAANFRKQLQEDSAKLPDFSYAEDNSLLELEKPSNQILRTFNFDPNTISQIDLERIGLSPKTVRNILNYRKAGGKFKYKEDFKRIYSLKDEEYQLLENYIELPSKFSQSTENKNFERFPISENKRERVIIEINSADSAMLTEISGIGPAFASRIIKYRSILGGFYSESQLLEVYGFDSVKLNQIQNQIKIDNSKIQKININSADYKELSRHPYIKSKLANAIINYRKQHGNYQNAADLKKIIMLDDATYQKLLPYIRLE